MSKNSIRTTSYLPWQEATSLVCSLIKDKKYHYGLMIGIGIYTGMRISDILNLRWEQVLSEQLVIKEKKTGKQRIIALHPDLQKHIEFVYNNTICCEDDYIFYNRSDRNKKVGYHGVNKALKKIFLKYNVSTNGNVSSHCLRKTFGRRVWDQDGQSDRALILLSSIFKHSNTEITRRYLGIVQEEINDIYMKL